MTIENATTSIKVCKSFTFEAAHSLRFHTGKCRNEHGHSYTVRVCYSGSIQHLDENNSESGMVIDFAEITRVWKDLEKQLDHQNINTVVPYSTAERLAVFIAGYFQVNLPHKTARLDSVRVYETATGYTEVSL